MPTRATARAAPPRTEDFLRQQAKIVTAINTLDADIVSLEEIENSVQFGKDRDDAVSKLVDRPQRRRAAHGPLGLRALAVRR